MNLYEIGVNLCVNPFCSFQLQYLKLAEMKRKWRFVPALRMILHSLDVI